MKNLEDKLIDFYWRLDDCIDEISMIGRVSQNEEIVMLREIQAKLDKILDSHSPKWVKAHHNEIDPSVNVD